MNGEDADTVPGPLARIWEHDLGKVVTTFVAMYGAYVVLGLVSGQSVRGLIATLVQLTLLIAIYAMLSLSLNLQWGYTGLFNIGIVGFMAVGAYTMLMVSKPAASESAAALSGGLGMPFVVGALAGIAAAALLGLVVALPALRLRADYLAIVTIAMAEIVRFIYQSGTFQEFTLAGYDLGTGGGRGLLVNFDDPITTYLLESGPFKGFVDAFDAAIGAAGTYAPILELFVIDVVLLGVVAVYYWLFIRTGKSPFGRVLKAIREDEDVARALGKNTGRFKIKAFMLGCGLMGLAGVFYAVYFLGSVQPIAFKPRFTFFIWVALIIGGAGSYTGSVIGSVLFVGVLLRGPLFLKNVITNLVSVGDAPATIAGGLGGLLSLDVTPLIAYTLENINLFRIIALGVVLIALMKTRPQGLFGHRKETAASIPLGRSVSGGRDTPGGQTHSGEADGDNGGDRP